MTIQFVEGQFVDSYDPTIENSEWGFYGPLHLDAQSGFPHRKLLSGGGKPLTSRWQPKQQPVVCIFMNIAEEVSRHGGHLCCETLGNPECAAHLFVVRVCEAFGCIIL